MHWPCNLSKVFVTIDPDPTGLTPVWFCNFSLDARHFEHIPTCVSHPWELPSSLHGFGAVLKQNGAAQDPLRGAVSLAGFKMNIDTLKNIQAHLKFPMPGPKKGSGKGGRLKLVDYVKALVKYLFPDASDAEFERMCSGLLGKNIKHLAPGATARNTPDIMTAFAALDQTDKSAFIPVVQAAMDEEFLIKQREKRAMSSVDGVRASQEHFTPSALQRLCPKVVGSAIRRHLKMKRYQAFYPYEGVR